MTVAFDRGGKRNGGAGQAAGGGASSVRSSRSGADTAGRAGASVTPSPPDGFPGGASGRPVRYY